MKYAIGEKVWSPEAIEVVIDEYREVNIDICDQDNTQSGYLVSWNEITAQGWNVVMREVYLETELFEAPFHPIRNQIKKSEDRITSEWKEIHRLQALFNKYYPPEGTCSFPL
jgi:hypothetical protein